MIERFGVPILTGVVRSILWGTCFITGSRFWVDCNDLSAFVSGLSLSGQTIKNLWVNMLPVLPRLLTILFRDDYLGISYKLCETKIFFMYSIGIKINLLEYVSKWRGEWGKNLILIKQDIQYTMTIRLFWHHLQNRIIHSVGNI